MTVKVLARVSHAIEQDSAEAWREGYWGSLTGIEYRSLCHDIEGEFLSFDLGAADLFYLRSSPQMISRDRPCPKRFSPTALLNLSGTVSLSQNGKSIELEKGQFIFFDSASRLEFDFHDEFEQLYIRMPASNFPKAEFYNAIMTPADTGSGFNDVFYELVSRTWNNADELEPLEYGALLNSILSLSHLTSPFRAANRSIEPCIRMKRAMTYIEDNLAESWLTPERVAQAQGVSRRYLDERFGRLGLRIERYIWERRLTHAHDDLMLAGRNKRNSKSIIQIALDSGFSSPSHFSRSFKARFGVPPRDLKIQIEREAALCH